MCEMEFYFRFFFRNLKLVDPLSLDVIPISFKERPQFGARSSCSGPSFLLTWRCLQWEIGSLHEKLELLVLHEFCMML